jgi:sarcosine oxidase subunit gamma
MPDSLLAVRPPFAGLPMPSTTGHGVVVSERDGLGLATILARKGREAALAERVRDQFGIVLPKGPHRAAVGDVAFASTGPGAWLATGENGANRFAVSLKGTLAEFASVSDQSDGYAFLRLSGPRLRETLAKGISIDLDDGIFKPGDVAATAVFHIGTTLWRLDDAADDSPVFEIAVFRSLAGSFWHWLCESAAEFGLVLLPVART